MDEKVTEGALDSNIDEVVDDTDPAIDQLNAFNTIMTQLGWALTGGLSFAKQYYDHFSKLDGTGKFDVTNAAVYVVEQAPGTIKLLANSINAKSVDKVADKLAGQDVDIEGHLETIINKDIDIDKAVQKFQSVDPHNYPITWGTTHAAASVVSAAFAGLAAASLTGQPAALLWAKAGTSAVNTVLFNLDLHGVLSEIDDNIYSHCAIETAKDSVNSFLFLSALGPQALGGFAATKLYTCISDNKELSLVLDMVKAQQIGKTEGIHSTIMAGVFGINSIENALEIDPHETTTVAGETSPPTDVHEEL